MLRIIFLIFAVNFQCLSQVINIHSITYQRQPNGGQYTLDGTTMDTGARLKLLSTINFGAGGVYAKSVNIIDGFLASNSLTQVVNFPYSDLFFFGTFDKSDGTLVQFTNEEIDSLYNWSKRGGKLIICGSSGDTYNPYVLNSKWGFQIAKVVTSSFIPNSAGLNTDIFNGPFGAISSASQGGSMQGYFNLLPGNVSVLARDASNRPTIIMDCATLDLIVADVDGYTSNPAGAGAVSTGNTITNDQDKYFANTIAFMDKLQPLPQITNGSNVLSLNSTYNNYQWYLDSLPINAAVNSTYTVPDTGNYYVEVTLNGGCKLKSNSIYTFPTVGLPEIENKNTIYLYPNPTQQFFNIELPIDQNFSLLIYNESGQKVYERKNANGSLKVDCSNFSSGMYFVKAINAETTLIYKLIKE